jgi:hypothetical protein
MICQKREPRPKQEKSGVPGNPHGGWFCEDSIEETRWRGRYFLRNVWHEQPVGHALLEVPDHAGLVSWD